MSRVSEKLSQKINQCPKKQWIVPIVDVIGAYDIESGSKNSFAEASLKGKGFQHSVTQSYVS